DRERNEHLAGDRFHGMDGGAAILAAGGDVEEGDLVGALVAVALGDFDGIAGIADIDELHALHHATVVAVETGDDAFGKTHGCSTELKAVLPRSWLFYLAHGCPSQPRKFCSNCRPFSWLFSGWNCTAK